MLNFDSKFLFASSLSHPFSEMDDLLGDMKRIYTISPGPSNRSQAVKILNFFGMTENVLPKEHAHEHFLEIIHDVKMRVFSQLTVHEDEWRVDWSRQDHAFCLWHRAINKNEDITTDLDFVRKATLDNIQHTEIKPSRVHGFGLFATAPMNADHLLTFLDGQIMSRNVYEHRLSLFELKLGALKNHFFMEWNIANSDLLMVRSMRTKYSFINHCNKDNVALVKKENSHLIELVTTRPIQRGEELFLDYRKEALPRSYFHLKNAAYLKEPVMESFYLSRF